MHRMTFRRSAALLFAAALIAVVTVLVPAATAGSSSGIDPAQTRVLAPKASLTVSIAGKGIGWVTSDPAGISCGTICTGQFAIGTTVTLKGLPAVGSENAGYSGCQGVAPPKLPPLPGLCKITLTGDATVQFTFNVTPEPCSVPSVKGRTLANAKQKLLKDACRPGKVTRVFSNKVRKGRVLFQNPGAGWQRLHGAVNLVVSKGSD